jgi:hypothetical protein
MNEIIIRNLRDLGGYKAKLEEYQVRVDRASVLGNPFRMDFEAMRNEVCDRYEAYFNEKIASKDEIFLNELRRLYRIYKKYNKLELCCWCAPKRCHATTIKKFLEKFINKENE